MMNASNLDFKKDYPNFPEFAKYGLPLHLMQASYIELLQQIRTDSGISLYPSAVSKGWGRTDGSTTSRHYAVGRLSDAGDIFPARGRFLQFYTFVLQYSRIGGVGIYADCNGNDGKPWPMVHLDTRRKRLVWGRDKGVYCYLNSDSVGFGRILQNIIDMERRS